MKYFDLYDEPHHSDKLLMRDGVKTNIAIDPRKKSLILYKKWQLEESDRYKNEVFLWYEVDDIETIAKGKFVQGKMVVLD